MSLAEPVGQPLRVRHSERREGPAAEWMAPSCERRLAEKWVRWLRRRWRASWIFGSEENKRLTTPPPPRRDSLAALTIEVVARVVIEVRIKDILEFSAAEGAGRDGSSEGWRVPFL